jgi:hypothetical protein
VIGCDGDTADQRVLMVSAQLESCAGDDLAIGIALDPQLHCGLIQAGERQVDVAKKSAQIRNVVRGHGRQTHDSIIRDGVIPLRCP